MKILVYSLCALINGVAFIRAATRDNRLVMERTLTVYRQLYERDEVKNAPYSTPCKETCESFCVVSPVVVEALATARVLRRQSGDSGKCLDCLYAVAEQGYHPLVVPYVSGAIGLGCMCCGMTGVGIGSCMFLCNNSILWMPLCRDVMNAQMCLGFGCFTLGGLSWCGIYRCYGCLLPDPDSFLPQDQINHEGEHNEHETT